MKRKLLISVYLIISLLLLLGLFNQAHAQISYCGDGNCDAGEDCNNCSLDCGVCPPGYCGDGDCQEWLGEACDVCVPDCGTCQPPGTQVCETGTCPDGRDWKLYCEPSCDAVPRTCWYNNSCTWPPDNCNEYGGDAWCESWVSCGPGTVDCTIAICGAGGNCYADCTYCDGDGSPPPDYSPPPEPSPPSICIAPTTPTLNSPANGTETPPDVILVWNPIISWGINPDDPDGSEREYRAYLDTSSDPSTLRCTTDSGTNFCVVSGLEKGTTYYWKVIADNGCASKESAIWSLTIQAYSSTWFQTQEGDVHAQGSISSDIPDTATDPYFNLVGDGGTPGVVSHRDPLGSDPWGSGSVSETGWLANTEFSRKYFNYFYQLLDSPTEDNFNGSIPASDPNGDEVEIYYSLDNAIMNETRQIASGRKVIILVGEKTGETIVERNVKIEGNYTVVEGGFLTVIASGEIEIGDDIPEIHGVFIADEAFKTGTGTIAFTGEGTFVANSFDLDDRDLEDGNDTTPAVKFIYRPDLWLNAPAEFLVPSYTWQELAP